MSKKNWTESKFVLLAFYLALSFVMFWIRFPELIENFDQAIPLAKRQNHSSVMRTFFGGDHLQVFYTGWKLKENLVNPIFPGVGAVFTDPYNFASKNETFTDALVGLQYLTHAVTSLVMSDIAAYNFSAFVLSTALCMLFAHLFFRVIGASLFQAVLAGIVFAWLPYRINQMAGGHSGGIVAYCIPLYFYAIFGFRKYARQGFAALAGITLFLITISDEHQGYYLLIASMFIFPIWFFQSWRKASWSPRFFGEYAFQWRWLLVGLFATLGWGWFLDHFIIQSGGRSSGVIRGFSEIRHYSMNLESLIGHRDGLNIGHIYFWSLFLLGPATLYLWYLQSRSFRALGSCLFDSVFFVLVPVFLITLILTAGIGVHWTQKSGLYELFYQYLPYFKYQRVPIKLFALPAIALAALFVLISSRFVEQLQRLGFKKAARAITIGIVLVHVGQGYQYLYAESERNLGFFMDALGGVSDSTVQLIQNNTNGADIIAVYPFSTRMDRSATFSELLAIRTKRRFAQGYQGAPPLFYEKLHERFEQGFVPGAVPPELIQEMQNVGYSRLLARRSVAMGQQFKSLGCEETYCLYEIPIRDSVDATRGSE